jgi:hypothetical protein
MIDSGDIEREGFRWFMRDTLPRMLKPDSYIYNLDYNRNQGTHWVNFTISNNQMFYFDPLSIKVTEPPPPELQELAKRMGITFIVYNDHRVQPMKSFDCGFFSLMMAKKLRPMIGQLNEKRFYDVIKQQFGTKPSDANEKKVYAYGKQIGKL